MIDSAQSINVDLTPFDEGQKKSLAALVAAIKRNDDATIGALGANLTTTGTGTAATFTSGTFGTVTLTTPAPSPPAASTLYTNNICKAWVTFNLATATILAKFNVSAVARLGVGDGTVTFATSMADTNYTWSAFGIPTTAGRGLAFSEVAGTRTVNGFEFLVQRLATTPAIAFDDVTFMGIQVFGN